MKASLCLILLALALANTCSSAAETAAPCADRDRQSHCHPDSHSFTEHCGRSRRCQARSSRGGHISIASFGCTETHRVNVIELKPEDRAHTSTNGRALPAAIVEPFFKSCLVAEDHEGNEQVLFRVYE